MKRLIALIVLASIFSFTDKKISYDEQTISDVREKISKVYDYIDRSNLPHQDVIQLEKILQSVYTSLANSKTDSTVVEQKKK